YPAIVPARDVEVSIRPEMAAERLRQPAHTRWHKSVNESAIRPVVAHDVIAKASDHVEMPVWSPSHSRRTIQAAVAVGGNQSAEERAVGSVVTQHLAIELAADVERVAAELQPHGIIEPSCAGEN